MAAIDVHGLSFAYPNGERLFDDVSFRIAPGAKVALVGSNGAGNKSSRSPPKQLAHHKISKKANQRFSSF